MYLWQFNNYLMGYRNTLRRQQENIVSLAYQTAGFINSKKKPKPLSHYIEKIKARFSGKTNKYVVDIEKSKEIEKTIERLKQEKEVKRDNG